MFWIIVGLVVVVLAAMASGFFFQEEDNRSVGVASFLVSAAILFFCANSLLKSGYGYPASLDKLGDGIYKVVMKAEGDGKTYVLLKDKSKLRWMVVPETMDPNVLATGYVQKTILESEVTEKRTYTGLKPAE